MGAAAASQDEGFFAGAVTAPLGWFFSGEKLPVAAAFWLNNRAEQGLPSLRWGHCLCESHWLGEDVHFLPFWPFYELYL